MMILSGIPDESFADKRVKLHLDQEISADGLTFILHDVNDSRCPSDVTCVWGGYVTAMINIKNQTHSEMVDFVPGDGYTFFWPYKIALLDVSPYPVSTYKPDDYVVTLVMYALDGSLPCEKHMTVKDGVCVSESPSPIDFRESGEGLSLLYALASLIFVGVVVGFFILKKWNNRK